LYKQLLIEIAGGLIGTTDSKFQELLMNATIKRPTYKTTSLVTLLTLLPLLFHLSSCKELDKKSDSKSVEAILSGNEANRYNGPCGEGPEKWEAQSPNDALQRVFNAAPAFATRYYDGKPSPSIVLADNMACVCGNDSENLGLNSTNDLEACWREAGRVEQCGNSQAALRFLDVGNQQPQRLTLYVKNSTRSVHRHLISGMIRAMLDAGAPSLAQCKNLEALLEEGLAQARSKAQEMDITILENELERIQKSCAPNAQNLSQLKENFARLVILPADAKDQDTAKNVFQNLFEVHSVATLEEAVVHAGIQNFLLAESIDSFYCSAETNSSLRANLPAAWAAVFESFGNPSHFIINGNSSAADAVAKDD